MKTKTKDLSDLSEEKCLLDVLNRGDFVICVATNLLNQIYDYLKIGMDNNFELSKEFIFTLDFMAEAINKAIETIKTENN